MNLVDEVIMDGVGIPNARPKMYELGGLGWQLNGWKALRAGVAVFDVLKWRVCYRKPV